LYEHCVDAVGGTFSACRFAPTTHDQHAFGLQPLDQIRLRAIANDATRI